LSLVAFFSVLEIVYSEVGNANSYCCTIICIFKVCS